MSWQEKLDGLFPSGLKVVQIDDVPEGVGEDGDNSPTFLTPRLEVLDESGDEVVVRLFVYEFPKDVIFTLLDMAEFAPGVYHVKTPDDEKDLLLTADLPKSVLAKLKEARGA